MSKFIKGNRVYYLGPDDKKVIGTVELTDGNEVWCNWEDGSYEYMNEKDLSSLEEKTEVKKVYKGWETLERMRTHWVTDKKKSSAWKVYDDGLVWMKAGDLMGVANEKINFFLENEFTDYVELPKVGDWIAAWSDEKICKVVEVREADILTDYVSSEYKQAATDYRKATPEEVKQEKRRRLFKKVGREVDEFKEKDGVRCNNLFYLIAKVEGNKISITEGDAHNVEVDAKDLQLIYPVEHMINFEE